MKARAIAIVIIACLFATAVSAQDEQAREDEFLIRGLIRDGLYEVAADRILTFIYAYPEHPRRRSMVEDIVGKLLNKDSATAAVPLMRAYRELFPSGNQWRYMTYHLAATLFSNGDYDEAAPLLEEITGGTGYSATSVREARTMLARLRLRRGEFGKVITLVESVPQSQRTPELLLLYAEALLAFGEESTAEEVLASLNARRRIDGEIKTRIIRLLGDLYIRQNRWEGVVSTLGEFSLPEDTKLNDDERAVTLALGVGLYHLERYEEAWNAIRPLWREEEPADTGSQMPVVFMALNEFEAAAEILKTRFEQVSDVMELIETGEQLVLASVRAGDRATAARTLQAMAKAASSSARRVRFLLRAASLSDDMSERIRLLREATLWEAPEPLRVEAHYFLGDVLARTGNAEEAASIWSKTIDLHVLSPYGDLALLGLAEIETADGKLVQAARRIELLLQRKPALELQQEAHTLALRIAVQRGNWPEAEKHFQQLRLSVPEADIPPDVWRARIRASLETNNTAAAASALERLYLVERHESDIPEFHPLLAEARQLISAGEYERGIAFLSTAEKDTPADIASAARFMLAKAALDHGDTQEAYDLAQELAAESTGSIRADAAFLAAAAAGRLGEVGEQVRILRELIELANNTATDAEAVAELKEIATSEGNYNGALQVDPRFTNLKPDTLYAVERRLGEAARRYAGGDYAGALTIYEQLPDGVRMQPLQRMFFASSLFHTGAVERAFAVADDLDANELPPRMRWERDRIRAAGLALQARYSEALAVIEGLMSQPLPDEIRQELQLQGASIANAAGDWPRADEFYRSYIAGVREREIDTTILEQIARDYIAHEQWDMAIDLYRRVQLRSEDTETMVLLGFHIAELIALRDGPDAAAEEFLNIAYRYPELGAWPAKARLRAAEQFERAGHLEIAMRQYRLIAERYADTEEARTAAARLRTLAREQESIQEEQLRPPGN